MKFSCSTSELTRAVQLVSRAIGGTQALPILGNILLKIEGDTCELSATDLELSISTSLPAKVEQEGRITIPAKTFLNFVQYNTDAEVMLELKEGNQLHCKSSRAKAVIAGEAATEYPTIAEIEKQTEFSLTSDSLLKALHYVTFASARTSLRPVLSGVFIRSEKEKMILVATDSYRLSEYQIQTTNVAEGLSCIVPTKILDEVRAVLSSLKDKPLDSLPVRQADARGDKGEKMEDHKIPEVHITLSRQQIEFTSGQTKLLSRLIEGKFPDYNQIIPKDRKTKVAFTTKELLPAVRRMHYFAKEVNNKLTFILRREEAHIVTPQTQAGRDEATMLAELQGDENGIALSSAYLLDLLSHIDSDVVMMEVQDSSHPAVFLLPTDERFLHLIMPLRMTEG